MLMAWQRWTLSKINNKTILILIFCLTCFNIIDNGNVIQNHLNLGYIGNFEDTGKQEDSPLIVELIHSKLKVFR